MTQRTETKEELAKNGLRSKKNMSWWNIHKIIEQPNTLVAKQATNIEIWKDHWMKTKGIFAGFKWNMSYHFVRKSDSMVNVYGLADM